MCTAGIRHAVVELSAPPCICFSVYTHLAGCDHDLCFDSGLRKAGEFQCLSEFDKFIPDLDLFFHLFDLVPRITIFRTIVVLTRTHFAMPTDSQTLRFLLVVAAFAVYSQSNRSPLSSELDAPLCCFVCAWLIANAQITVFRTVVVLSRTQFAMPTGSQTQGVCSLSRHSPYVSEKSFSRLRASSQRLQFFSSTHGSLLTRIFQAQHSQVIEWLRVTDKCIDGTFHA